MYRNGNQGHRSANTRRIVSEAFRKRAESKIICIQQERIEIMTSWNMKDWEYTCQVNNNQYHGTNIFPGTNCRLKNETFRENFETLIGSMKARKTQSRRMRRRIYSRCKRAQVAQRWSPVQIASDHSITTKSIWVMISISVELFPVQLKAIYPNVKEF